MEELQIEKLTKVYPNGVKALDDVNLKIGKGMFGLLGPNGAGKSTLMRTIATLQNASSGEIYFKGKNIFEEPENFRKQLGYLPQEFGVYQGVSAYRLLDHLAVLKGLINPKERKEQVLAVLQQTNLYSHRKKAVSSFSGGMRQRFGIAQALLGNPKLIIVDEPTAGLDPEERNRFHNLLSEIGEQVVVLLSTHIVSDVRELCPEMAVLANGKIAEQGKPQNLIENLKGKVWAKSVDKTSLKVYEKNFTLLSCRMFAGQPYIHLLADVQPDSGFELVNPDLEDVYFTTLFGTQTTALEGQNA
ncbi:ABC transporter ATP-binding protein [Chondrinema litorale]|uniref:ABC transporter ATP-binding protein n=1 Tax=Chondrinema litorale TaxID=2994555 RepID=UPI002543C075|nr:ABC transporter ATP-binding protein [Chondrinema litorale]UZR98316.1 ABC transporter ATP-binding protein [Chondrinema litorale]